MAGDPAQLDDLKGDSAADGVLLLGHVDCAEAAVADELTDEQAGSFAVGAVELAEIVAGAGRCVL
jgi:hypothetical protein